MTCCLAVLVCSCTQEKTVPFSSYLEHDNGLVMPLPNGYSQTIKPQGFYLSEARDVRYPESIDVTVSNAKTKLHSPQRRVLSTGETALYDIVVTEGGSGGSEYQLTINRSFGDKWVKLVATMQSERGMPEFEFAWAIAEAIEFSD